jgi:hypothetical protein
MTHVIRYALFALLLLTAPVMLPGSSAQVSECKRWYADPEYRDGYDWWVAFADGDPLNAVMIVVLLPDVGAFGLYVFPKRCLGL